MASYKDTFESHFYACHSYASGMWRGRFSGVDPDPTAPTGDMRLQYALEDTRLHYRVRDTRPHYRTDDRRLQYRT